MSAIEMAPRALSVALTPIPAPLRDGPLDGLWNAVGRDEPAFRFDATRAFGYEAETCPELVVTALGCAARPLVPAPSGGTITEGTSFEVTIQDECSTTGWAARDVEGRLRREMDACFTVAAERALWRGLVAWPAGTYLCSSPNEIATGPVAAEDVVPQVEYWARRNYKCGAATLVLHMTPEMAARLLGHPSAGLYRDVAGQLRTRVGNHLVIAGYGYTGEGPQPPEADEVWLEPNTDITAEPLPASEFIYVTGTVMLIGGETTVIADPTRTVTPQTNMLRAVAYRPASIAFDNCPFGHLNVALA